MWIIVGTLIYLFALMFIWPENYGFHEPLNSFIVSFIELTLIYAAITFLSFDSIKATKKIIKEEQLTIINKISFSIMVIVDISLIIGALAWPFIRQYV